MASSLVKSVCLTQRTGLSPRTRNSGSRFFSSRRILKPDSLTARGLEDRGVHLRRGSGDGVAGGLDDFGHGEAELAEAFVAGRRDFEDPVAAGFEFRADEFGHVLAVGQVHLVQGDQAGAVVQRNDFAVGARVAHVHGVLLQLGLDDGEVGERVAVRFERAAVQDVHQGGAALDVAQEVVAEALAFAGAFDEARDVGDGEADFAGLDDAEVRDQGGERVVGDLGPRGGHGRDQAGLAGGREADQGDVGDGLQFQDDVAGFAFDAEQREAGGAALLRGERGVAEAADAAGGRNVFGALAHEVGEDLAVLGLDHGAIGDRKDQGFAVLAAAPVAHAGAAVGGVAVRGVVVVQQGGGLGVDAQDDVAAVAAVAAVGTAERLELLAVDGDTTVAAGTAGYMQYYPVYKAGHVDLLSAVPRAPKTPKMIVMRLKHRWSGPNGPPHRFKTCCYSAAAAATMFTTRRPRRVPNSTAPGVSANRVSSPPRPTPAPGWKWVPRWRTMISPAETTWPPKRLTPRYWAFESRPLRVELAPFLCAI